MIKIPYYDYFLNYLLPWLVYMAHLFTIRRRAPHQRYLNIFRFPRWLNENVQVSWTEVLHTTRPTCPQLTPEWKNRIFAKSINILREFSSRVVVYSYTPHTYIHTYSYIHAMFCKLGMFHCRWRSFLLQFTMD